MGITLQSKAVCDRCGEQEVYASGLDHNSLAISEKPEGWSKATHKTKTLYLCSKCTLERARLDDIHAAQLAGWFANKITGLSIDYLCQWIKNLGSPAEADLEIDPNDGRPWHRDPLVTVADFKYNPNCLTGPGGRDEFYKRSDGEF